MPNEQAQPERARRERPQRDRARGQPAQDEPAQDEPGPAARAPIAGEVLARPVRSRRICRLAAAVIVVVSAAVAALLTRSSNGVQFGRVDQVGLFGIGLAIAAGVLLLGRPTLAADERGLRVRNILGRHDVPWPLVRAVSFRDGSPWASLDLIDDETIALMAVQAADGERTVEVVRVLRALHDRSRRSG